MICVETQSVNLNKILLLAVGLWPYQQTKLARFQYIFFLGILTTALLFQFNAFLTSKCTSYFIVKILCAALSFSIFVINYIGFALNIEAVTNLRTLIQYTYNDLKGEFENVIKERYSYRAKWYTVIFATLAVCGMFVTIVAQIWLSIYYVILSRNVSESHYLFITTKYFIDQEKRFYLIILHTYGAICIGVTAMLAIGATVITHLQHICGMLRISSYRIKRVMRTDILQNTTLENEYSILKGLVCAIDIHRQAMKLSELMVYIFDITLFYIIFIGIISVSLNLFRIRASEDNSNEYFLPVLLATIITLYMFIANYIGQDITDHTNHIVTAYSVEWYLAPLRIRRIILFLLQIRTKSFILKEDGLLTGSLECFLALLKASVSFFTVICSIQ